ncbi:hypothetical protein ACFL4U_03225 [Candidatus Neomarinimicrobiota bacterium]
MNGQNHDPFDIMFQKAQVDLPDHLRHRLLAVPRLTSPASFGDSRWILPIVTLIPGLAWFIINYATTIWRWVGDKLALFSKDLAIPAIPAGLEISPYSLALILGFLLVAVAAGSWLHLRMENQTTTLYAQHLTEAHSQG